MSQPRQVLPGSTYLLSRRCYDRTFFIRPSEVVNQILLYCLAVAVKRYDILLHAYAFMSNHLHINATDPKGNLPEFMRWLNEFVAKSINALHGRWESIWSPGSYSAVRCVTDSDVLDEIVYTLTNPVSARLVKSSRLWPGLIGGPSMYGKKIVVRRPDVFFRSNGPLPDELELELVRPQIMVELTDSQFAELVSQRVRDEEARIRREAKRRGQRFLGAERVLATSPFSKPRSSAPRRRLSPHVACKDIRHRVDEIGRLREFRHRHREAVRRVRAGQTDTVFPAGTYWMRVYLGVSCAPSG